VHFSPPQQRVGQSAGQTSPRARRLALRALPIVVLAAACGDVRFIPSPYTPQHVELIYSAQEHLTVVRWRVTASAPVADTHFELLGPDGYRPIDFTQSAFPGGVIPCQDGRGACAQYVVRGQYTVAKDAKPIQAVHELYGVLPGGPSTTTTVPTTLTLDSFFAPKNRTVYVNITDDVGHAYPYDFPRPFERSMWDTSGVCLPDTPVDGPFEPLDNTGGFAPPTPLSELGTYCVATRPVPSDGGDSTVLKVRIATLPEVVKGEQQYEPPIEYSPVIYQVVLDLDIPVADRCAEVIRRIEDVTGRYMKGGGVPVYKLPTINLAAEDPLMPCAQVTGRTMPAAEMAQAVKQLVTTLPGKHQQYHLMYFNNIDAPLPIPLVTSIETLLAYMAGSPPGYEIQTYHWLFGPFGAHASEIVWWAYWLWLTADDNFEHDLGEYSATTLPYTTQFHDPNEPVDILSPEDTAKYAGKQIKICTSVPQVNPWATLPFQHVISDPSWQITVADPPAYLVSLPNHIVVETSHFVDSVAVVDYEICTNYCKNHPYVTASGEGEMNGWNTSYACTGSDY